MSKQKQKQKTEQQSEIFCVLGISKNLPELFNFDKSLIASGRSKKLFRLKFMLNLYVGFISKTWAHCFLVIRFVLYF